MSHNLRITKKLSQKPKYMWRQKKFRHTVIMKIIYRKVKFFIIFMNFQFFIIYRFTSFRVIILKNSSKFDCLFSNFLINSALNFFSIIFTWNKTFFDFTFSMLNLNKNWRHSRQISWKRLDQSFHNVDNHNNCQLENTIFSVEVSVFSNNWVCLALKMQE